MQAMGGGKNLQEKGHLQNHSSMTEY